MCVDKLFESDRLASTHLVCFETGFLCTSHRKKGLALCAHSPLQKERAFIVLQIVIRGRLCVFHPKRFELI